MTQWEYYVSSAEIVNRWSEKKQAEEIAAFQARLNEAGAQGWEMISFDTIPLTGSFSNNIKGYVYLNFFKRPQA